MTAIADRPAPLGELLRDWRRRRRMSQLDLALEAGVSARHLSFLETGRSQPSRDMVLRLSEELEVPLRDRNRLLLAAGFAPAYEERPLEAPEMEPVRRAVAQVLTGHEPFPAAVVDRWWNLVAANRNVSLFLQGVAAELLEPPANVLRVSLHPDGMAPRIANLAEWRGHLLDRLRREVAATADTTARGAARRARGLPGSARLRPGTSAAGRARRPARAPPRRPRAVVLQHGGHVRHRRRRHGRRAVDRGVLPGGRGDGRVPPSIITPDVIDTLPSGWHGVPMTAHTATITTTDAGLLRFALRLDAAITAANGAAYLALCWLLDGWLGVPAAFLAGVGAFLVAFAAFVGRLAVQASPARGAVIAVIAANVLWVLDSALLLAADWFSPTVAGQVVIALQAAGVAGLAALQYAGLRRA